METMSLKALAEKVLQRHAQGNFVETPGKREGQKFPENFPSDCSETNTFIEKAASGPVGPVRPCHICGTFSWWEPVYGALRCGCCLPPASPALVGQWIGDPEAYARLKASKPGVVLSLEECRRRKAAREDKLTCGWARGREDD